MITESQMSELYARTAQQYRREPSDEEFEAWQNVLDGYRFRDVSNALDRWLGETLLEEFTNRPKGARMPSPAEVKLLVQTIAAIQGDKFEACQQNGCMSGWIREFEGFTTHGNKVDKQTGASRRCRCFYEWVARKKSA